MSDRIKGQETTVTFASGRGIEQTVEAFKSASFSYMRDTMTEGYLGETAERVDDIYKHISGKLTFHLTDAGIFDLVNRINEVSQRRLPGEVFQIASTWTFPNNQRRRVIMPSCVFGEIPFDISDRDSYVESSLDFKCRVARVIRA